MESSRTKTTSVEASSMEPAVAKVMPIEMVPAVIPAT
jgi:hypothetical protein